MTHQRYTGVAGFVGQIGAGIVVVMMVLMFLGMIAWVFDFKGP